MDLALSKEQQILLASAREFLRKECPKTLIREMREDVLGYPPELWKKMAELGWMGVLLPEEYAGTEGDFIDLCLLMEAIGEACLPGPFFSTVVLGGLAIQHFGSAMQKDLLLPRIADGKLVVTLAATEPGLWYGYSAMSTRAVETENGYEIRGKKVFVENASAADVIICAARIEKDGRVEPGLSLFLVDGGQEGIRCRALSTLGYDKQYEVDFSGVAVPRDMMLGEAGQAEEMLDHISGRAAVAKCAEMVGSCQSAFDMAVAYAKEREQFGQPIGSFQAIQHHCANMAVDMDSCRYITYQAAWRIARGVPAEVEIAMAKAWTSSAAGRITRYSHQIQGAIGFCEEHDMHLYYRRAKTAAVAFGDSEYHYERVAQELGL